MARRRKPATLSSSDKALRQHLLYLLKGGGAHLGPDRVFSGLPTSFRGRQVPGSPHTIWQLMEHIRIAQWDILDFSRNPDYSHDMTFPDDYWPKAPAPPSGAAWNKSLKAFKADLRAMQKLVENPRTDLFARIPWGDGQTVLREALLVADHNAYHLGQVMLLRRQLESSPRRMRVSI